MKLFRTTKDHSKYWENRKIDWQAHYMNPDHPHRLLIAEVVRNLKWGCIIELGCGAGANLVQILNATKSRVPCIVGGVDINPDAIALAQKTFIGGLFKTSPGDDVMMSDKSVDLILTDMYMIYLSPRRFKKQLKEIKRLAHNYVVLCELHSDKWQERLAVKWDSGYNMYNYKKLLQKNGFYDINMYKMPKEFWPGGLQEKYCHIIVARVPKDY